MRFDLDDQERALQAGIRDLCRGRFGMERVRAGLDRPMWHELGEAGVFSLRLSEPDGIGLGTVQAVLVFEELGRALVPGPLVASHLAAGLVDGAASGERIVGIVEVGSPPVLVEHLDALDALLVLDGDRLGLRDPVGLDGRSVPRPLDPLTPLHAVDPPAGGTLNAEGLRLAGGTLTAAFQLGIAQAATDLAVAYSKEREQFGRPIGSFQAVKHLCADMFVRAEVARAAVYAAGCVVDDPDTGDVKRAVATAQLLASDAALANGKTCIQVHGGMGFTWEVDAHLYLKRAAVLSTHFGGSQTHAGVMASFL